jgi:integrase
MFHSTVPLEHLFGLTKRLVMLKIFKPKRRNGTYYFRCLFDEKELCNSLFTKEYSIAKVFVKELGEYLMSKLEKQKYTFEEVRQILSGYIVEARELKCENSFKCRDKRYEAYRKNNPLKNLEIGILTELKVISDLLANFSEKNQALQIRKLKAIKNQVLPLLPDYNELANERHGKLILEAQNKLIIADAMNYGLKATFESNSTSMSMKQAFGSFKIAKKADNLKSLSEKQLFDRTEMMLNILTNYNLNAKLSSFGISDYDRVQEIIRKYPTNISKKPQFAHLMHSRDINLILETAQENKTSLLSVKTANDYIRCLNQFLNFCYEKGFIQRNFLSFKARKTSNSESEKIPYSVQDINNMLTSKRFDKDIKSVLISNPEHIWITLIAMFSGARLSEICQLHFTDIDTNELLFSITDTGDNTKKGQSVKSKNSKRVVPIHGFLIKCGFLQFLNNQVMNHHHELYSNGNFNIWGFQHDKIVQKYGWGRYWGKLFQTFNRTCITTQKNKTFHSFRHNFITYINETYPEKNIITTATVGHTNNSINVKTYTHTEWITKKRELIDLIDYPQNKAELTMVMEKMRFHYGLGIGIGS